MAFVRVLKPPGGDTHDLFNGDHSPCVPGHHRVLKPPGGGSSDIFGTPDSSKNKRQLNQMQSNIFTNGDVPHQNGLTPKERPGNDSMKKIFGSSEPSPSRKVKDHMKSKIFSAKSDEENDPANANQSPRDTIHMLSDSGNAANLDPASRNRVPPGGHSTKLW